MRSLTLVLLAAANTCNLIAQSTFEKLYDGLTSFTFNLTELPSHNIFVGLGPTRAVSRINSQGQIIGTHSYWADPINPITSIGGIRMVGDNEFLFAGGVRMDSCTSETGTVWPNFYPVLGKMDSLGNILDLHCYQLNGGCRQIGSDVLPTNDGGIVTWGYDQYFFVLKAATDMQPTWAKRFNHKGGFHFIKELPGGDLLAGINMDTAGAVVARMDADGNFLWCKSYIRPKGIVHDAIIESDDSFIITGYTDSTTLNLFTPLPAAFQPKLFMMKLDGAGTVQWCKGYDSAPNRWYTPQWSRLEKCLDGNYAVVATLGDPTYNFFYRPFFMKTDQNGDTLWTRSMGRFNYSYYARDLLATWDGGYLISGDVWGNLPGNNSSLPYLFKTDSLGHLPCWERRHPVQLLDLFPTDSSFTLTSVDGAMVHPAYVSDTTFAPITVYDVCTFTTGMPPMPRQSSKM